MDRNIVRCFEQLFNSHAGCVLFLKVLCFQERVICNDGHAKSTAQLCNTAANAAKAHYAEGAATQLTANKFVFIPLVLHFNVVVCSHGIAGKVQHFGNGQLCNSICVEARSVKDLDAFLFCIIHIDVVQANGANADNLQIFCCIQNLFVDFGIHTHNQNFVFGDQSFQFFLGGKHFCVDLHKFAEFRANGLVYCVNN